jgi:hypothetical protein
MLIFFSRHLSCGIISFLEALYARLMRLNIILVFFIIRLVPRLPEYLAVYRGYFPRELNGDLLRFSRQFVCRSVSMPASARMLKKRYGPSAPSSSVSTSTPPPPSPPESLACFRTSFHERYVRRRLTLPRSWRMRKMRSSAVM